jgi:hypothetical protein
MSIDDPVHAELQSLTQDLDASIQDGLAPLTVAGILSLIPGVGAAVQSLLDGRAQANVQRRWIELFVEMKKRIEEIRASIPDYTYYSSENFKLF